MKVSAVVVSHGSAAEVAESLPALEPQVDELVVIANIPGSVPAGVDAIANERPLGFAANANLGVARTSGEGELGQEPHRLDDALILCSKRKPGLGRGYRGVR